MEEEFIITDTVAGFINWVNSYGQAQGKHYIPVYRQGMEFAPGTHTYYVITTEHVEGKVRIKIEVSEAELLTVTATLLDPLFRTEPLDEALQQNFREFCQAIRKKYPQPKATRTKLYACNRWLFVEYFEKGNINLEKLKTEWLRIRKEEDLKSAPTKPVASMRTAINEEKERRKA